MFNHVPLPVATYTVGVYGLVGGTDHERLRIELGYIE